MNKFRKGILTASMAVLAASLIQTAAAPASAGTLGRNAGSSVVRSEGGSIQPGGDGEEEDLPAYITRPHKKAKKISGSGRWKLGIGTLPESSSENKKDKDYIQFQAKTRGKYTFCFNKFYPELIKDPGMRSRVYFEFEKIAVGTKSVIGRNGTWVTVQILDDDNEEMKTEESFILEAGEKLYIKVKLFNCYSATSVMDVQYSRL